MPNFSDKLNRIINSITSNSGLTNLVPGSKAYDIAEAVAYEQYVLERDITNKIDSESLLNATGSDLDNIGEKVFGIPRRKEIRTPVSSTMKLIKFYVSLGTFGSINNGNDIIIPEGVLIEGTYNSSLFRFRVTEQVTLPSTSTEVYVSAAMVQGSVTSIPSGVINKHNFTTYAQGISKTLLVSNTGVLATGRPEESDENYRFRLINTLRAFPKTTKAGIIDLVTEIPGVSTAVVEPASNGGGSFTVYVQGISPITSDELVNDVFLSVSQNIGPWVTFNVSKYNYIGLELSYKITLRDVTKYIGDTSFIQSIQDAVSNYINNFFGSTFYILDTLQVIEDLTQDILDIELVSAKRYNGNGLSRGSIEYDLNTDPNPVIELEVIEKLIIEPISNPILVAIQ